ncbi:MAG: PTS fructose transporter subunit IIABC [Brevinema sp.]
MSFEEIKKVLSLDNIEIQYDCKDKKTFIEQAAEKLTQQGICTNKTKFIQDVLEREKAGTDLEEGVAIPHAKSDTITKTTIFATTLKNTWANQSGGEPIKIAFLLAIPKNAPDDHIKLLSMISTVFLEDGFLTNLSKSKDPSDFLSLLTGVKKSTQNASSELPEILAVTACPVGVAHTYVAAEKLRKAAEKLGVSIKVETNGSIGVENALTAEEIKHARGIILACDVKIDLTRFSGKKIIDTRVSAALDKSEELIQQILDGKGEVAHSGASVPGAEKSQAKKTPFYQYLMAGVSAIIPVVVVGGVYIALAIAMSGVKSGTGIEITNPLLQKMEQIGGLAFGLMIPILAGFISQSIADRPGLIPGFVGGALAAQLGTGFLGGIVAGFVAGYIAKQLGKIQLPTALKAILPIFIIPLVGTALTATVLFIIGAPIKGFMDALTMFLQNMSSSAIILGALIGAMITFDMGGPVNKVAFLFGVSMIQSGVPEVMGMVAVTVCTPPLGMWLATKLRPSLFDEQEREAGNAALLMGMIGITEGAIPFAVANPFRVIPSLMAGGIVAGMIAGAMKVADYAPHGGPIVLPVVDNKVGFIIAVAVGTVITAMTLVALLSAEKKKSA